MESSAQQDARERRVVLMLRKARLKLGLSAAKLAEQIGVSRAAITHLEANRSRPTLWMLLKISDGLGVKPSDWFPKSN